MAAATRIGLDSWAVAPIPLAGLVLLAGVGAAFSPPRLAAQRLIPGAAIVLLAVPERVIALVARGAGTAIAANVVVVLVPLLIALALLPAAYALRRAGWKHLAFVLIGWWLGVAVPGWAGAAILFLLVGLTRRVDLPLQGLLAPGTRSRRWAMVPAIAALGAGGALALAGRLRTDTSPHVLLVAAVAVVVGALWPRGGAWMFAAFAALFVWAALLARDAIELSPWLQVGAPIALSIGAAGAMLSGRSVILAALVATGFLAALLPALPAGPLASIMASSRVESRERQPALSAVQSLPPALAEWSLAGPVLAWRTGALPLIELEGQTIGTSGRARDAERMAGVIAGCTAHGRSRARVVGDDLGLVATGLVEQGFSTLDIAAPDGALPTFLAKNNEELRSLWLKTGLRLLTVPGPLLVWAGAPADTVVIVARSAESDGRMGIPSDRALRALRRSLGSGGSMVLVVPALWANPKVLGATARAVSAHFNTPSVWLGPAGAETAIFVGAETPITRERLHACADRSSRWLGGRGLAGAPAVGALAIAGRSWMKIQPPISSMAEFLPRSGSAPVPLAWVGLDLSEANALDAFNADLHEVLAPLQATNRAALGVFAASALGDIETALRSARAMAAESGASVALEPLVRPLLDRARATAALGQKSGANSPKWDQALAEIDAAVLLHPASSEAQCLRGEIYAARRQADPARKAFERCTELSPANAIAWDRLGQLRRDSGDLDGAESAWRKALSLAPERWEANLNLGILLSSRGRFDEAERWLRRAAAQGENDPGEGRSRPHLALAYLHLRKGNGELALAEAERAEAHYPNSQSAFFSGSALVQLRRFADAEPKFRLALNREPEHVQALHELGRCLEVRGDIQGATDAFRRVVAAAPANADARADLDRVLAKSLASPK